jgi:hypothetical protein
MAKQDMSPIVAKVLRHRANERQIAISPRRIIKVYPSLGGDYAINRHEIRILRRYVLSMDNPFEMIDPVLTAIAAFDMIAVHEQAQRIVRVKTQIMQSSAYLERSLSPKAYSDFVHSLNHRDNG